LTALTDIDFVIGPMCKKFPKYFDFYKRQVRRGRYVILDNGAFEGELLTDKDLLEMAEELCPTEIVAPDVIGDRQGTKERVDTFLKALDASHIGTSLKVQACPQGRTMKDWMDSYKELSAIERIDVLGITYAEHLGCSPKNFEGIYGVVRAEAARLEIIHKLVGEDKLVWQKPHHLLGLYDLHALPWYSQYPFVRSIDTSFPVACGRDLIRMHWTTKKPRSFSADDYELEFSGERIVCAIENLQWIRARV